MTMLKQIVQQRLEELGLGPVEAAVAGGIERTYIRDIIKDKKKSVRSDKLAGVARALRLNADALSRGELVPIDQITLDDGTTATAVPLIATVSAGEMMRDDLFDEAIETLSITKLPAGDWFALKVDGDSMDRISPPDSIILVNRKDKRLVNNACYVISDVQGNASYKRYRPNPDRFEPVSTNPAHEPIFPDNDVPVVGRVKRTMLDM